MTVISGSWVRYLTWRMTQAKQNKTQKNDAQTREDRLKHALKANMAKRKAQAKARAKPEQTTAGKDT